MARWKAHAEFLLSVIELLFLSLMVESLQGKCVNVYRRVTDRKVDGRTDGGRTDGFAVANTALAMQALQRAVKNRQLNSMYTVSQKTAHLWLAMTLTYVNGF